MVAALRGSDFSRRRRKLHGEAPAAVYGKVSWRLSCNEASRVAEARLRPCGLRRGSLRHDRLAEPKQAQPAKAGGARRDRTADLVIANDALSQLSYGPLRDRLDVRDDGQQSAPFTIRAKV